MITAHRYYVKEFLPYQFRRGSHISVSSLIEKLDEMEKKSQQLKCDTDLILKHLKVKTRMCLYSIWQPEHLSFKA